MPSNKEQQRAQRARKPSGWQSARCRQWRMSKRDVSIPMPERCEICGSLPSGNGRSGQSLHWDHDHITGEHRGWLCNHCNLALGQFKDSPAILRAAANYLERQL